MQADPAPAIAAAHMSAVPDRLRVDDLNRAESMVIHAIRRGLPGLRSGADVVGVDDHDLGELRAVASAVERYLRHLPPDVEPAPAVTSGRLGSFEMATLRALACLQEGLLGEAWKSLVPVCGRLGAGKSLVHLQEVADVLQLRSRRIERWHFDPAFLRAAGLI